MNNQSKNMKYAGFTLVEMMVVILIIAILLSLGSFGGLFSRRENVRIEELAVNLVGLIDGEKTSALLGKTEGGAIVRKRKVTIEFDDVSDTITYKSYADLAEDEEDSYCSASTTCPDGNTTNSNTPLTTKEWTLKNMAVTLWKCTGGTATVLGSTNLEIVMTGDVMTLPTPADTEPHLILQLARNNVYREIHIDRRTGLTYERAGLASNPSCT